ncbi:MAG: histidine kinase [Saprospiraceae bacterium]
MAFQQKINTILTLVWLMLPVAICMAQQPFMYKYTIEDGLPYPEIDFISFTKSGEAWVRYSSGEALSRFDGINWTHYRLDELGLPLGLAFLSDDEFGVWFTCRFSDKLWLVCLTPAGEWKKYEIKLRCWLYFDPSDGRFILMDAHFFSYKYDAKTDLFLRSDKPAYALKEMQDSVFYYLSNTADGSPYAAFKTSENTYLYRYGEDFQYSFISTAPDFKPIYISGKTINGLFWKNGQLQWWDGKMAKPIVVTLPTGRKGKQVRWSNLNYWGRKRNLSDPNALIVEDPASGIFYLYAIENNGSTRLLLSHLPKDIFWSAIAQDKHGHWWCGTSSGLVRTNQSQLVFNETTPGMVTGLHAINEDLVGNIWMGGYTGSGGFTVFDGDKLQRQIFGNQSIPVLPGPCHSASGTLYFFVEAPWGMIAIRNTQLIPIYIPINENGNPAVGFFFQPLRNGLIALGLVGEGLGIATEDGGLISSIQTIGKEKGLLLDNVLTVSEDGGGRLWVGRMSQGVAIYDPQRDTAITWLRSPDVPNSIGAMASCVDENGTLWLGTNDGIRLLRNARQFDYLHENLFDRLEKIPMPGAAEQRVHFLKNTEQYLVAGTPEAVYFFDKKYHGRRPRIFSMKFGIDIAGGGAEQNAVLLDSKGFLWIGAQEGATRIDLSQLQFDTSATSLVLTDFRAGDEPVPIIEHDLGRLPGSKRNMQFSFSPSGNDRLKDNLFYDVLVVRDGGNTLFRRISTQQKDGFQIDHLPYGDYTLQLVAYKHNVLSGQVAYHFRVPRLLSENPWFWAGLFFLLTGTPFAIFYQRKRHQAALEKSKRERDGLKIQALASFFNPHFINNSLNWVQSRYRKDPQTTALMGRLADNVDILYSNTQFGRAHHALSQEMKLVKNYLKIQQVRFGEALTVEYDVPEELGQFDHFSVPAMLLQIHAENAVEKGIRMGTGVGRVAISVRPEVAGCRITIEDDGRGRPFEVLRKNGDREGSTSVMDNLIKLLNSYNKEPITQKYEDHVFDHPERGAHGTRVHIFIPKNYRYEFS